MTLAMMCRPKRLITNLGIRLIMPSPSGFSTRLGALKNAVRLQDVEAAVGMLEVLSIHDGKIFIHTIVLALVANLRPRLGLIVSRKVD